MSIPASNKRKDARAHELFFNTIAQGLPEEFPFSSVFSLEPMIEDWRSREFEPGSLLHETGMRIEEGLARVPELARPIIDFELLDRHEDIVSMILAPVFPNRSWTKEQKALVDPFGKHLVYQTASFRSILKMGANRFLSQWLDASILGTRILYAYRFILQTFYNATMQVDQPIIHVLKSPDGYLNRYYKLTATIDHVRVRNLEPIPDLGKADLHFLLNNVDKVDLWMDVIPPEVFEFSGFQIVTFMDVTSEVSTASLEHVLLTSELAITSSNFDMIQDEVRCFFRKPFLKVGLASLQRDGKFNFESDRQIWNSLFIRDAVRDGTLRIEGSLYEEVLKEDGPLIIGDVAALSSNQLLREYLLDKGIHCLILCPLRYEGKVVGLLELTSSVAGDLNALATLKLDVVESIFSLAVYQNLERFEDRVTATVRETFTAIHPSVAWRFREVAISIMESGSESTEKDEIVFENVYPHYASADIRGSSESRNAAVRTDLIAHLNLVLETFSAAMEHVPVTLVGEIMHRTKARIAKLEKEFHSGDESETSEFIRKEVIPVFNVLKRSNPDVAQLIDAYNAQVDPRVGILINEQHAYAQSVRRINETITGILDRAQTELQNTCPHYFEKYKTDGVEHIMYIGASLVPNMPFDMAYVRNLRLHQLITCCQIGRAVNALKSELALPLDIAQLVLVQDTPHAIRFRLDEKKFDVEGAYGIRYEVIKKRIDKATIRDSNERLSQPGKIAIVYSFEREAAEYRRYLEFMQADGTTCGPLEELELSPLQGVSGLKAIRVAINFERPVGETEVMTNSVRKTGIPLP